MAKFIFTWENLRYSVHERKTSIWQPNKERVILDGADQNERALNPRRDSRREILKTNLSTIKYQRLISYLVQKMLPINLGEIFLARKQLANSLVSSACLLLRFCVSEQIKLLKDYQLIVGYSGSGKTTLLTLMSGHRRGKGVLKINGQVITGKMLRSNSAFLQQKDHFLETLTVREHMSFMAAMCLKKPITDRNMLINKLLIDHNLDKLKYILIQYLSGGEKRKLSLATQLLLDPYILFWDEPTSGLDSFSAISIVKILETVAATGKIVFMTAHQPSSQLFDLFDNIILLSTQGKFVFHGSKNNARSFFNSEGLNCPKSYNPADFYIKNIAINSTIDDMKVERLTKAFNEDYAFKFNFSNNGYNGLLLKSRNDEKNFFYMLSWLIWRVFITIKRNLKQYFITFLIIMFSAFLIGLSYSNIQLMGTSSVQGIQGALLLIVSELIFNQVHQLIYIFPAEIEIFIQEKNLYASFPYFLSKLVSLIPFSVIYSFGFLVIYFMFLPFLGSINLFVQMYLILLLACLSGSALGLCLSAVFPTIESVHLFIVPLELLVLVVSGLWIRLDTLPKFFSILKYSSPFYFCFESLSIVYWLDRGSIDNCTGVIDVPCFQNGTEILKSYDFAQNYNKVTSNFLFLLSLIAVYCYLGYIGILRKRALYHI